MERLSECLYSRSLPRKTADRHIFRNLSDIALTSAGHSLETWPDRMSAEAGQKACGSQQHFYCFFKALDRLCHSDSLGEQAALWGSPRPLLSPNMRAQKLSEPTPKSYPLLKQKHGQQAAEKQGELLHVRICVYTHDKMAS